ncbi:hypothetical protein [Leptospira weilii]|nr:hypothetical protein [Leptospira weilii]
MIEEINNTGLEEFDGLSPRQMHDILYEKKQNSFYKLNPNDKTVNEIPLVKQLRYFLNQIEVETEVKLTKAGNLPPTLVKELYSQKIFVDELIENGFTKLTKETDSNSIVLTRVLCELSGILKKRNGTLSLTSKGRDIYKTDGIFPLIFDTFANTFNWSYFDGYSNKMVGQFGNKFSLFLIHKYGDVERNTDFYSEKYFKAFPQLLDNTEANQFSESYGCYSVRTFRRFLDYFGFIRLTGNHFQKLMTVRKSETFDEFIVFKPHGV